MDYLCKLKTKNAHSRYSRVICFTTNYYLPTLNKSSMMKNKIKIEPDHKCLKLSYDNITITILKYI